MIAGLTTVSVTDFGADPTGVADSYAAIQAAYDSDAAIIQFPSGTFRMSQTLYIDRGITINGSGAMDGSGNNGQSAGVASTVINYTGTGNCIDIVGNYTEGVSNVHLSNFMINGNVLADGGLFLGSGTHMTKCTFKNLGIFKFLNATTNKGYGVAVRNCLETVFENIYVHGCHDGFNIGFGASTSCEFRSCFSRVNNQYGWNIRQGNGHSFYQCMAEGNRKTGLVLNTDTGKHVAQLTFYSWYSEANGLDADTYPAALVTATGTGVCNQIYFNSPIFYDYSTYNTGTGVWDIAAIKLGKCSAVQFTDAGVTSQNTNFIECTSDTVAAEWQGYGGSTSSTGIANNEVVGGRMRVKTTDQQTPGFGAFVKVNVTDAFTTAWTIPVSTNGLLMVTGGTGGQYGGSATFVVCRPAIGNGGIAATSTFVGDGSSYTISWQLTGSNFELKHNQTGVTIQATLYFMAA